MAKKYKTKKPKKTNKKAKKNKVTKITKKQIFERKKSKLLPNPDKIKLEEISKN